MPQEAVPGQAPAVDEFVKKTIQQFREKLLDLSSRNPLLNFRHSERSRSHIRIVDEVPETLFQRLSASRQMTFVPLPHPELVPPDERLPLFERAFQHSRRTDEAYKAKLAELGPNPSERQVQKAERELRNRVRAQLGVEPYEPTFDPKKRAVEVGIAPDYDLPKPQNNDKKHNDLKLQTLFFREDLDRKLGSLRESTRVLLQDAGLSALYCAFGFLEYYETEDSDQKRLAPLALYPIELERELVDGEYHYSIRGRNDEVEINVALKELLRSQYNLELPDWEESEDEKVNALATYIASVERMVANRNDWTVRRFVTFGLFTFATLAMYKDLDPELWPEEAPLHEKGVLRTLIAGAEVHGSGCATDYEIDDPDIPEALLITDADSSQHSAVIDVLKGKNIVVQGPPGTGKSQTITNIIAAALDAGKSVLFVAEKMAALEVVQKRLSVAGTDPFCLELHSSKTSKAAVAQKLAERLEYRNGAANQHLLTGNIAALKKARTDLLYYVRESNQLAGETGFKVRDILLGTATRDKIRISLPSSLASARMSNALHITPQMRAEMLDAAKNLQQQSEPLKRFGATRCHPWAGLQNSEITSLHIDQLIDALKLWQHSLSQVSARVSFIEKNTDSVLPASISGLDALCADIERLPPPPEHLVQSLWSKMKSPETRRDVERLYSTLTRLLSNLEKLQTYTTESQALLQVTSKELFDCFAVLRSLDLLAETIVTARQIVKKRTLLSSQVEACEAFATELTRAFGLDKPTIGAVRAACAGLEQLKLLPRDLWQHRSDEVLADESSASLHDAAKRCSALKARRDGIRTAWDSTLLPSSAELKQYVVALRTAGWISRFTNPDCKRAKRLSKAASRDAIPNSRLADELLRCAQYLDDEQSFVSDRKVQSVCGSLYLGLDTDFSRLLSLSNWAQAARGRLATHGQDGAVVLTTLFAGNPAKFRELLALEESRSAQVLTELVLPEIKNAFGTLGEAHERLVAEREALDAALSLVCSVGIRESFPLSAVQPMAQLRSAIEHDVEEADERAHSLNLPTPALMNVRSAMEGIAITLEYAHTVISAKYPVGFENFIFVNSSYVPTLHSFFAELKLRVQAAVDASNLVFGLAKMDAELWCGQATVNDCDLSKLVERCAYAIDNPEALHDYTNFLLAQDSAADCGIGPVLSAFSAAGEDYRDLVAATDFVFFRSCAEKLLLNDPQLRNHSGTSHEHLRKQFQRLDRESLALRRQLLASKLCIRSVPEGNSIGRVRDLTELALVRQIAGQTRPRITLRDLFLRAGRAIQALKPCWMMSPMSIAQFLEPGNIQFDLLLMDEASQIRPEQALGAIARAAQVVIVGDQMQLPPTSFFQKLSTDSADDDDEIEDTKQESVLEAAASRFFPPRRLKWHYRSEHGSLISFSNKEFYGNDLTVFPSPFHEHPEYGVFLTQVDGVYSTGTNVKEAETVVRAAADFMATYPNQSLGIVAVNSKQAELIREQLDSVFASDPAAEAYRAKWEPELESLFVKNLENVQGDERDVIFISTVYGKDEKGNFYQRFGPINSLYGHRRLNVLFTRAKRKVVVFTSMSPEEIQEENKHWGVRVLKAYLQYAKFGYSFLQETGPKGDACDSEFEEWVLQTLRANGFDAVPQFGFAGYQIDLAVKHPRQSGIFLCGLECDGATYHSARSVRERDRLRQEVLEKLGWKIYRIWSTDWFRNPALQTSNLLDYLRKLVAAESTLTPS
jgi:superfamily I DNA and/or RNA helicase/very-short-patch-repair endonuclease